MASIRHAVILAGGRGRRMMPLTAEMPKAMAPYRDTTLIAHGIERISRRVPNVHITVGYRGAMLAEHVIHHGARSVLNTDGQGNAWWVYNSLLSHLDEPIFVLTCDNIVELDFERLERDYDDAGAPPCMLVPVEPVEGLQGDYIFHQDQVVTGLSRENTAATYCSGIQILHPRHVCEISSPVGDFAELWTQLIEQRRLLISRVYPSRWFTADTVDQLAALRNRYG